jgi:hypothetical protein
LTYGSHHLPFEKLISDSPKSALHSHPIYSCAAAARLQLDFDHTVDIYGHLISGEGRAGLEAALAGGAGKGSGEEKIVPFSVP